MNRESTLLRAAEGYGELGMTDEALAELDEMGPGAQGRPDVLRMRLALHMQARRWTQALAVSRKLCRTEPEAAMPFIHAAFCLHELGRTTEAKECLLAGPPALLAQGTYYYNLACYEAMLGQIDAARSYLDASFQLDKQFRELAKTDPDLASLRAP